ncbi:MAG TPA: TolC family protein [Opitutaceae bacterium]
MRSLPHRTGVSVALILFVAAYSLGNSAETPASTYGAKEALSLEDFLQRVLERNKAIQARLMAFHTSRSLLRAENSFYEPALVSSGEYVDRKRANTIEIERSLRSGGEFVERNQNYSTAVEFRTPLNSKVRVGAGSRKLKNNIQRTVIVDLDAEYEANVGVSIEQPLLKGAGPAAAFASMRLAERNADAAFQEYRRQMMQIVAEAEMAYWQLHFAQEEYRLSSESVAVAKTIADDGRARFDAGRGSRLDVLEADAGLAVRLSRESEARQKWVEALNRMASYFATSAQGSGIEYVASDVPESSDVDLSFQGGTRTALAMSPDRLRARALVEQEKIRVAFAKNQRLPQVDLKASAGASGLGYDYATAWRDVEGGRFPAWTVSLEMRVPLLGGVRERNELRAARQRQRQAELNAQDVETQLASGLDTAQQRVESSLTAARNYKSVVEFRDNLLETQIQSAQVGRTDARTVLEAEQELFAARLGQLQSEIEHQRALLELQIITGNLLKVRKIELGMKELEKESWNWANKGGESLNVLDYTPASVEEITSEDFVTFEPEVKKPYVRPWHFWQRHKR